MARSKLSKKNNLRKNSKRNNRKRLTKKRVKNNKKNSLLGGFVRDGSVQRFVRSLKKLFN